MRLLGSCSLLVVALVPSPSPGGQGVSNLSNVTPSPVEVPAGVILVKGAGSSASDSVTPLPEVGNVAHGVFSDPYFGITYALPEGWTEKYKGPPPSDGGRYVLAELTPTNTLPGKAGGSILITAQDMFFTPVPARTAAELVLYMKEHLQADYKVEIPPTQAELAGRSFTYFAYWSPAAQLHWYILATDVRCHAFQIAVTSRDTKLLDGLMAGMNLMELPADAHPSGSAVPVCIQDYARDENMVARVNPVFAEHRFNPIPVRIIIDQQGRVKHIHFLSAFPDQAKAITDALGQWKFKPYRREGQPVEVETGILFGRGRFAGRVAGSDGNQD